MPAVSVEDWRHGADLCWLSFPHPNPDTQFPQNKQPLAKASSGKPKGVQAAVSRPDSLEAVASTLSGETRVTSKRTCPFQ